MKMYKIGRQNLLQNALFPISCIRVCIASVFIVSVIFEQPPAQSIAFDTIYAVDADIRQGGELENGGVRYLQAGDYLKFNALDFGSYGVNKIRFEGGTFMGRGKRLQFIIDDLELENNRVPTVPLSDDVSRWQIDTSGSGPLAGTWLIDNGLYLRNDPPSVTEDLLTHFVAGVHDLYIVPLQCCDAGLDLYWFCMYVDVFPGPSPIQAEDALTVVNFKKYDITGGSAVKFIKYNKPLLWKAVDFGVDGSDTAVIRMRCCDQGGKTADLYIDWKDSTDMGTKIASAGASDCNWRLFRIPLNQRVTGIHDLVFTTGQGGGEGLHIDWIFFLGEQEYIPTIPGSVTLPLSQKTTRQQPGNGTRYFRAKNYLRVRVPPHAGYAVRLFDVKGRCLYQDRASGKKDILVPFGETAAGVGVLHVLSDNHVASARHLVAAGSGTD
ncbi:MAG: hypothetical protein GF350_02325 [Chitinivibrionales bacterium]|nr:hypothetical protein [Chitinivibrionales bacterium]